jgi:hypothetical protein
MMRLVMAGQYMSPAELEKSLQQAASSVSRDVELNRLKEFDKYRLRSVQEYVSVNYGSPFQPDSKCSFCATNAAKYQCQTCHLNGFSTLMCSVHAEQHYSTTFHKVSNDTSEVLQSSPTIKCCDDLTTSSNSVKVIGLNFITEINVEHCNNHSCAHTLQKHGFWPSSMSRPGIFFIIIMP